MHIGRLLRESRKLCVKAPHTYFLKCVFASRHQNIGRPRANTKKLGGCPYILSCVTVSALVDGLVHVKYGHHCVCVQGDTMGDPQK